MGTTFFAKIKDYTKSVVVNEGNSFYVSIDCVNKGSGNYASELFVEFGNQYMYENLTIDDSMVESISTSIPIGWLSEIPDSTMGTGKIKVQTVNMDTATVVYEEIKHFTIYVPEEFKPEISNLSTLMLNSNNQIVDYAVYGLTKPSMKAMVTPHYTSPIKKYYITGGGAEVSGDFSYSTGYEDYNFSVDGTLIKIWANTKFILTVEDGRGRKASITSNDFYVQPYTRPSVNSLSAYRVDENGITKADGGYIKVTVNGAFSPIRDSNGNEINILSCFADWKKNNGTYGNLAEITNQEPFIFEANKDYNFEIKCVLQDKFIKTVAYCNVMGDNNEIDLCEGGGGAAIGGKAEKGYFDVAYESRFQKGISAEEVMSSNKGFISRGTGSKGDFLSFGEANRIETITRYNDTGGLVVEEWADFDEYTEIGLYGVFNDEDVSSLKYERVLNCPCEKAGTLRVYNATGNVSEYATEQYRMQEYVVRDGSTVYRRCLSKIRESADAEWPLEWTIPDKWRCYYSEEEGKSGIWIYKKCENGIAEISGKYETTISIPQNGHNYYNSENITFPFEFVEVNDVQVTNLGGYLISAKLNSLSNKVCSIACWSRESEIINEPQTFFINIKGIWK